MHTRIFVLVLAAACLALPIAAAAQATPVQVNVRIEGKSETLFEGPIWTEGHDIKASSDTQARRCDGTNNHQHATPGPTPTASAADAMGIIGETFDAQWYGSSFDDYFLTRFGPDEQNITEGAYWGILVNDVFTSAGGCQYELGPDSEVLWVYNAFNERLFLELLPVAAGLLLWPASIDGDRGTRQALCNRSPRRRRRTTKASRLPPRSARAPLQRLGPGSRRSTPPQTALRRSKPKAPPRSSLTRRARRASLSPSRAGTGSRRQSWARKAWKPRFAQTVLMSRPAGA